MTETKNEKFQRLATARCENAISYMTSMGKLMSPAYESSPEEREIIVEALRETLAGLEETYGIANPTVDEPKIVKPAPINKTGAISVEEGIALVVAGPIIDAAINDINDGNTDDAKTKLLTVMAM